MRRRRLLGLGRGLAAVVALSSLVRRATAADSVAKLIESLSGARSFKVRVQAAALLGRMGDPRAAEALARAALGDPNRLVRVIAIKTLAGGALADWVAIPIARQTLSAALADREPTVRRQAAASLAELSPLDDRPKSPPVRAGHGGTTVVALGAIGDRTGHAPKELLLRLRAEIQGLLQREPHVALAEAGAPGVAFLVDGAITKLSQSQNGLDVEEICAVDLVVSRPPRGIVTVASGEAIVQRPRGRHEAAQSERLQREAMENAVRGAHETLARFLSAQ